MYYQTEGLATYPLADEMGWPLSRPLVSAPAIWHTTDGREIREEGTPLGFTPNAGRNAVPFFIWKDDGSLKQANYVQIIERGDTLILGLIPGHPYMYGKALTAAPHPLPDGGTRPTYPPADIERHVNWAIGAGPGYTLIKRMKDPSLLAELCQYQYVAREWVEAQQEFIHVSTHFNELTMEQNDCIGRLEAADVRAQIQAAESNWGLN